MIRNNIIIYHFIWYEMAEVVSPNISHRVVYMPYGYKLEDRIGSGSFADVYRVTEMDNSDVMALKFFRYQMRTLSSYRLAAKEISLLSLLEHPNILQIRDYEVNKTYVYIATEFAAFGSLKTYMKENEPIAESVIQFVMRQVLAALDYLHEMGIIHGDVKPENILCMELNEQGPMIKIGDFGLSDIKLKGNKSLFFTAGSFLYMAPEVHLRYPVDCSCDLWSAGIVMYKMMYSRNIFNVNEKDIEKLKAFLQHRTAPNWTGFEAFSAECNDLVRNLLLYDKQNRLMGERLRNHPFIKISSPILPDLESVLFTAQEDIKEAHSYFNSNMYGNALVFGTKAIMKLKISYNMNSCKESQKDVKELWEKYEEFTDITERALLSPDDKEPRCPRRCEDDVFRKYLASTPKMLDGFDMGRSGEMYLKEGNKKKALDLFQKSLNLLLPAMKDEPTSNRKDILGRRMRQWMQYIELLTDKQPEERDAPAQPSTSASNAVNVPE